MSDATAIAEIILDCHDGETGKDADAPYDRDTVLELLADAFEQRRQSALADAVMDRHTEKVPLS